MAGVKHPCVGCVYFTACGSTGRTEPCAGRTTKADRKKDESRMTYWDEKLGSYLLTEKGWDKYKFADIDKINRIGLEEDGEEANGRYR